MGVVGMTNRVIVQERMGLVPAEVAKETCDSAPTVYRTQGHTMIKA